MAECRKDQTTETSNLADTAAPRHWAGAVSCGKALFGSTETECIEDGRDWLQVLNLHEFISESTKIY